VKNVIFEKYFGESMDLDQDEVFGASTCDGDLSSASFRFRRSEDNSERIPPVGSIHRGRIAMSALRIVFYITYVRHCEVSEGIRGICAAGVD
jgi:hypothetical protein